jgi:hypothetical protein
MFMESKSTIFHQKIWFAHHPKLQITKSKLSLKEANFYNEPSIHMILYVLTIKKKLVFWGEKKSLQYFVC